MANFYQIQLIFWWNTTLLNSFNSSPLLVWKCPNEFIQLPGPCMMRVAQLLSHVQLLATLRTVALQASLSMGFSRQEYWRSAAISLQRIFLTQGLKPSLLHWQADCLPLSHLGSLPWMVVTCRSTGKNYILPTFHFSHWSFRVLMLEGQKFRPLSGNTFSSLYEVHPSPRLYSICLS